MITQLLLVRATYMYGVVLHAHPVRGESHIQHNANWKVATLITKYISCALDVRWLILCLRNIAVLWFAGSVLLLTLRTSKHIHEYKYIYPIPEYTSRFFWYSLATLRWCSSSRTKECSNKLSFYLHTFPLCVFQLFILSLCLGAHSKHVDIPSWCLSFKTSLNWCENKQQLHK